MRSFSKFSILLIVLTTLTTMPPFALAYEIWDTWCNRNTVHYGIDSDDCVKYIDWLKRDFQNVEEAKKAVNSWIKKGANYWNQAGGVFHMTFDEIKTWEDFFFSGPVQCDPGTWMESYSVPLLTWAPECDTFGLNLSPWWWIVMKTGSSRFRVGDFQSI